MAEDALVGAGGVPLSADILRHLLESSQDVLYAVALDPVHMLYATPGFARRMGLPEDFLSRGYAFSQYLTAVHPDDQARVAELMAAIVATRSDAELPENPAVYRLQTPEGGWRVISDSYRILRNADGAAHTLIGNARDISERSNAQQTLKEREARFRLLAENSHDVFFSMRFPEGRYEYLSPSVERLFGHSPQDFYDDPGTLMLCIAPAWRETVQAWMADIARGDVAETYEFQVQDKAGRLRWMNQRQVLVAAPDGRNWLLQGVATDVTDLREAQKALADNEARFRSLAENSRDTFFSFRLPEGRYEFISANVADLFGHTAQEFYEDPSLFMGCVAPAWRERMAAWNAEIAQGQVRDKYEFEALDKQGRLHWIVERLVLVPAPDGQGMLLQGVVADITKEHEAREALRASEEHFRQLIEAWPDQVMLTVNLTAGRHEYVSPSMERVLGYAPQEFYDDPGLGMRVVAPQWLDEAWKWIEELKRGITRPGYEFELVHKSGQHLWIHQVGVLRPQAPGQDLVVQFTFRDITEERGAREALRQSEERYRELVEGTQSFITQVDGCGRFTYVNPTVRAVLGMEPEDCVGRLAFEIVHPDDREATMAAFQGWLAQKLTHATFENRLISTSGEVRHFSWSIRLHYDDTGHTTVIDSIARDITEQKRAEEALRKNEALLEAMLRNLPFDFWARDKAGNSIMQSEESMRLWGDLAADQQAEAALPQDTIALWRETDRKAMAASPLAMERRLRLPSGELRDYQSIVAQIRDGEAILGLLGINIDITEQKLAEAALRKSNARNRLIVETATEGIWTVDAEERATFVNDAMTRMMGYTAQEMLGLKTESFLFPEDLEAHRLRMEQRRTGQDEVYERRFLRKDGTTLWTLASAKPLWDEAGRYDGAFAMFVDISERKQAEETLREANARYAILAENVVDVIWTTDENLRWTYLSPSAERLSGIPLGRLMAMPFDQLFTPESMVMIGELMARRRQTPYQAGQDEAYHAEMDIRNADGALVPLEVLVRPMRRADGTIYGYCGTSRDISLRKRTEAALRLSQERYALALKGANDGIWDWDLAEDKVYYSDRWKEILGYAPDELAHDVREWTERIHPEDFNRVMEANQECIRGEAPIFQVEYRLRHKDGSYRWIFGRGAALADADGRVVRMAGAHTDITARKQAEEALYKSERLSRKLLESMHEGIWAVDANRRTTFVNERLCAMLGYASAELMNMSPTDVLEWPQRHVAESRLPDAEAGYPGASDYVLIRKDGTRFPAHVLSSPVMEEQGRFEGLVCGVVDLTERARMEHELRRNQARFEALYELSRLTPATEFQLASFTLREAIRLTDSAAGVLFFVSEDGQQLVPKAWENGELMTSGQVPCFPASGPLPWAMVLESGLPLLINDFSECAHHIPPGHPPVTRFLGVPALDGARPVAVLGLIGRTEPYTSEDTLQTTLLLDGMWREVRTRRDQDRIRSSLREKEALLHEVHHRVKNNLQVISSLMDMAGRRLSSTEARLSLTELRNKVHAMSLIHAQLQGSASGGGINMERFVRALFNQLREVYSGGLTLTLMVELCDLALGVDQAVPLGLALNEALTNVFKHASADGRAGKVFIRAGQDPRGQVCVLVRDDGPGLPEGLAPEQAQTLGMKLMHGLVRHQLGGRLEIQNTAPPELPGVEVCICFTSKAAR